MLKFILLSQIKNNIVEKTNSKSNSKLIKKFAINKKIEKLSNFKNLSQIKINK